MPFSPPAPQIERESGEVDRGRWKIEKKKDTDQQIVEPDFAHVIELDFNASEDGTKYRAIVRHQSNEHKLRHEAMGFPQGWDLALRQLEKLFQKYNEQ